MFHSNVQQAFGIDNYDGFYDRFVANNEELNDMVESYKTNLDKRNLNKQNRLLILFGDEDIVAFDEYVISDYNKTVELKEKEKNTHLLKFQHLSCKK